MPEETPLAPGQVHGFRAWGLSQEGLLTALAWHQASPWHGGENVASCTKIADDSPVAPIEPTRPRHPDSVDPAELWHHEDLDYARAHRAGRRVKIDRPQGERRLPQLVGGPTVDVNTEARARWEEVRRRALDQYMVDLKNYENAQRRYEGQVEIFTRRNEEYMQKVMEHVSPVEECTCGFYMVKKRDDVPRHGVGPAMLGVVQGYGRVVPYEQGWRFGKGVIMALHLLTRYREPRMHFYLDETQNWAIQEVEENEKNEELLRKARLNYPNATFYDDEGALLADWELVVSES